MPKSLSGLEVSPAESGHLPSASLPPIEVLKARLLTKEHLNSDLLTFVGRLLLCCFGCSEGGGPVFATYRQHNALSSRQPGILLRE